MLADSREDIVDNDVVRALERSSGEEDNGREMRCSLRQSMPQSYPPQPRRTVLNRRSGHGHMRDLAQNIGHLRRDGGSADPGQNGCVGKADDKIGTNPGRRPAEPSIWPTMMPTMERIIATSIATARILMADLKGRSSRSRS